MSGISGMPPAGAAGIANLDLGSGLSYFFLVTLVKRQLSVQSHQISRMLIKTSPAKRSSSSSSSDDDDDHEDIHIHLIAH